MPLLLRALIIPRSIPYKMSVPVQTLFFIKVIDIFVHLEPGFHRKTFYILSMCTSWSQAIVGTPTRAKQFEACKLPNVDIGTPNLSSLPQQQVNDSCKKVQGTVQSINDTVYSEFCLVAITSFFGCSAERSASKVSDFRPQEFYRGPSFEFRSILLPMICLP
jgi:hypothetical protein